MTTWLPMMQPASMRTAAASSLTGVPSASTVSSLGKPSTHCDPTKIGPPKATFAYVARSPRSTSGIGAIEPGDRGGDRVVFLVGIEAVGRPRRPAPSIVISSHLGCCSAARAGRPAAPGPAWRNISSISAADVDPRVTVRSRRSFAPPETRHELVPQRDPVGGEAMTSVAYDRHLACDADPS
jgi:hypothetical protein